VWDRSCHTLQRRRSQVKPLCPVMENRETPGPSRIQITAVCQDQLRNHLPAHWPHPGVNNAFFAPVSGLESLKMVPLEGIEGLQVSTTAICHDFRFPSQGEMSHKGSVISPLTDLDTETKRSCALHKVVLHGSYRFKTKPWTCRLHPQVLLSLL
jgi:hypothetical protein